MTFGPPSLGISIVALVVSIALPLYLDSRQKPRISVIVDSGLWRTGNDERVCRCYRVVVLNRGRIAIGITRIMLSSTRRVLGKEKFYMSQFDVSPQLPHELGPYSTATFMIEEQKTRKLLGSETSIYIYGSVGLSNGYRVRSRRGVHPRTDTDRVVGKSAIMARVKLFILSRDRGV